MSLKPKIPNYLADLLKPYDGDQWSWRTQDGHWHYDLGDLTVTITLPGYHSGANLTVELWAEDLQCRADWGSDEAKLILYLARSAAPEPNSVHPKICSALILARENAVWAAEEKSTLTKADYCRALTEISETLEEALGATKSHRKVKEGP